MSKVKIFINPELCPLLTPYVDFNKVITVQKKSEAELCIDLEASNDRRCVVFMSDPKIKLNRRGNYISLLQCPYSDSGIYALTNNKVIYEVFNHKISIQKTTSSQAKAMMTYWMQANSLFKSLITWQKKLLAAPLKKLPQTFKETYDCT